MRHVRILRGDGLGPDLNFKYKPNNGKFQWSRHQHHCFLAIQLENVGCRGWLFSGMVNGCKSYCS